MSATPFTILTATTPRTAILLISPRMRRRAGPNLKPLELTPAATAAFAALIAALPPKKDPVDER